MSGEPTLAVIMLNWVTRNLSSNERNYNRSYRPYWWEIHAMNGEIGDLDLTFSSCLKLFVQNLFPNSVFRYSLISVCNKYDFSTVVCTKLVLVLQKYQLFTK